MANSEFAAWFGVRVELLDIWLLELLGSGIYVIVSIA